MKLSFYYSLLFLVLATPLVLVVAKKAKKTKNTKNKSNVASEPDATPNSSPVPNLQWYRVTIKNDTPYNAYKTNVLYGGGCKEGWGCEQERCLYIDSGYNWVGPYRGGCLITSISATLKRDDGDMTCKRYFSNGGTGYSEFVIILIGDVCCVESWAEDKKCDATFIGPDPICDDCDDS